LFVQHGFQKLVRAHQAFHQHIRFAFSHLAGSLQRGAELIGMVDDLKQGGLQAIGAADLFNPGLAAMQDGMRPAFGNGSGDGGEGVLILCCRHGYPGLKTSVANV